MFFWKKKKVKEKKKVNDLNGQQSCLLNLIILDFDFNNRGNDRIYSIDFVACVQPPLPSKKIGKDLRFFLRGGAAVWGLYTVEATVAHKLPW